MKASKVIRQGNPLSPFLFTMVVEALSTLLIRARELRMIQGFEVLHFAGNTILFSLALKKILRCFQLVLGPGVYLWDWLP